MGISKLQLVVILHTLIFIGRRLAETGNFCLDPKQFSFYSKWYKLLLNSFDPLERSISDLSHALMEQNNCFPVFYLQIL